jgi:hypothetical protein
MDHARSANALKRQGPQKFEARAKTGAAEQERVKARQRSRDYEAALGLRSLQASQWRRIRSHTAFRSAAPSTFDHGHTLGC